MSQPASASYVLGGTQTEKDRLLAQADDHRPLAQSFLDRIEVGHGWRVLDVGCGPIGILDLLSERVGPAGEVIGLEREPRFVDMARQEVSARGLSNVRIVQADALHTGLEPGTFDLVHERLVLVNVPEREALLAEMVSLARPGGTVAVEDIDNVSWLCEPGHASWDALLAAFHDVHRAGGGDPFVGRKLTRYLARAGLHDVRSLVQAEMLPTGRYRRTHLLSLVESIADKLVAGARMSEDELARHRAALRSHLEDEATVVMDKLLVQAWGRKPG